MVSKLERFHARGFSDDSGRKTKVKNQLSRVMAHALFMGLFVVIGLSSSNTVGGGGGGGGSALTDLIRLVHTCDANASART